jgi:hypothetical protein
MRRYPDTPSVVIPAQAGIQLDLAFSLQSEQEEKSKWMTSHTAVEKPTVLAGMTASIRSSCPRV